MFEQSQGIPNLVDLTHPQELTNFGGQVLTGFLIVILLTLALGITLALITSAVRSNETDWHTFVRGFLGRYANLIELFIQGVLILILLVMGFYLCSTLANRYHHWEQEKISQIAASVSGERIEQVAPKIRYQIEEPYSYDTTVNNQLVRIQDKRKVDRYLAFSSSEIEVKIDQVTNTQDRRNNYLIDFAATYKVTNTLPETQELFFEVSPPYGYSLLQNFRVEKEGKRLEPVNPNTYSFPLRLKPNQSRSFRVAYGCQGASRWIYNAGGELLSNFRLNVRTNFPNADFASGIVPTKTGKEGTGIIFTWLFADNVSVQNPFGVFTATKPILQTGILPRLLLLAPGLFLWWLLLLYLSLPMGGRNVVIAGAVFFACLLALTYLSRIADATLVWGGISALLLILVWGLGNNTRTSLAAIICTIAGAIVPVYALLIPYTGLTLSVAGLLSVIWLTVNNGQLTMDN